MTIDIIIATFNSSKCIGQCLQSVVNANAVSTSDLLGKVIIQDGCSRDSTLEVIDAFSSKLPIIVNSEADSGVYEAWNRALLHTSSEWILFLGSDDTLVPEYFNLVSDHLNSGYNWIVGKIRYGKSSIQGKPFEPNIFKKYMSSLHPGSLTSSQLFQHTTFNTEYKIAGDYAFYSSKIDVLNVYCIDEVLVYMAAGGLSDSDKVLLENYRVRRDILKVNTLQNIYLFLRSYLARRL